MKGIFSRLRQIKYVVRSRQKDLRTKMMMYFTAVVLTAVGVFFVILISTGRVFDIKHQMSQVLDNHLNNQADRFNEDITLYTAYGIQLSRSLSEMVEETAEDYGIKFDEFNNNADALYELQGKFYPELNTVLRLTRSSGAYAFVDATVNTQVDGSESSKSGVWVRLNNVSDSMILNPEITLFRGNTDLASKNKLTLNTKWELELNSDIIPGYEDMMGGKSDEGKDYYWTEQTKLPGTGDSCILLCVPVSSSKNTPYGICGVELNEKYFNLNYPAVDTIYGSMITVIAPYEDSQLKLDAGMTGNTEGTWLDNTEGLFITLKKNYNIYGSTKESFYGVNKILPIKTEDGKEWVMSVLVPKESADIYINHRRILLTALLSAFTFGMLAIALYLSNRFVKPILNDLNRKSNDELPPDLKELFNNLTENVKTLTRAEYSVYEKYLEGYDISEIPDELIISANTVKKHNKSIYKKLNVSSYDELSLYFDIFRRCGRIDELRRSDFTQE